MALNTNTIAVLTEENKTYYDRKLLIHTKPKLVHYEYGQKKPLPKNEGTTINFRKFSPFAAATTALTEGVVPDGQSLTVTAITATIEQYGGYVAMSDFLDMTAIDPVISESVELMGEQEGLTIDTLTRDVIAATTNVQYADSKSNIYTLQATSELNTTEIRKAVRTLKKADARKFMRGGKGYYIAIVSPDSTYDLQSDTVWQDVSKYSASEQIFDGEIGKLFGVIFVETSEAKYYTNSNLISGQKYLTTASIDGAVVTVDEAISESEATALADRYVNIFDATDGTTCERRKIESAAAGAAGEATVTLDEAVGGFTQADGDVMYANEYGYNANDVHVTLVFGRDAYGVVDLGGKNTETHIKPRGSAGTADPLDQISTVGWKVNGFVAKILDDDAIVAIHHGVTA